MEPSLARLVGRERPGSFADLGCGSGVLAIAASKLDFDPVTAVDADRAAVLEAARNARENGAEIQIDCIDLRRSPSPTADVVAANLTANLLETVVGRWAEAGERPGIVIASGFLCDEADRIAAAFAEIDLEERRRLALADWAALMLA